MSTQNLIATDQSGLKQSSYIKPRFQGETIGCEPSLGVIGLNVEPNFGKKQLFVKTSFQIAKGMLELRIIPLCEPISDEDILSVTNQKLDYIISGSKVLPLKKSLAYVIDFRDNIWTMENKEFGIISMSEDFEECLRDFNEEVYFAYEEYGQEDDINLTEDAKELKRKILQYVAE